MGTIDKYPNQHDEFFHPLWLGILILFSTMIIIGILCYLRIKCNSQLRTLHNHLFCRNNKKTENSSCDEKNSTVSYPYNWPSIHTPLTNQSPKLYTLVKNIRTANLENSLSLERQISNGNEMHVTVEINHPLTSSPVNDRAPEIARKFYSSLRNISQLDNSLSLESYNNDAPLTSNNPGSIIDSVINSKRKEHRNLFRTPRFAQSIPHTDELTIVL